MKASNSITELGYCSDNSEMIIQNCHQRKHLGHKTLVAWNDNTKHEVQMSTEFIEELFIRLEKHLQESSERIQTITQFLSNLSVSISTEMKFNKQMKLFCLNRDTLLDPLYSTNYDQLHEKEPMLYAMLELNREYQLFEQKLRNVNKRIRTEIVEKLLGKSIGPYEKTVKQLRTQAQGIRKTVAQRAAETVEKLKKFEKAFEDSELDVKKKRRVRRNTFDVALEFVESVKSVDNTLADYGMVLVATWKQCMALEAKRISATRASLVRFMDIMKEIFGAGAQEDFQSR